MKPKINMDIVIPSSIESNYGENIDFLNSLLKMMEEKKKECDMSITIKIDSQWASENKRGYNEKSNEKIK